MKNSKTIKNDINFEKLKFNYKFASGGARTKENEDFCKILCKGSVGGILRPGALAGKYIGIFVGSTHTEKNYVFRLIDHNGQPLEKKWKENLENLINSGDYFNFLNKILRANTNYRHLEDLKGKLIISSDNTKKGRAYKMRLLETLKTLHCEVFDYKTTTYPELVYLTVKSNREGEIAENDYFENFYSSFKTLSSLLNNNLSLSVDTGNGHIEKSLALLNEKLKESGKEEMQILNKNEEKEFEKCGADFVRVAQKSPVIGMSSTLCCSFDFYGEKAIFYRNEDLETPGSEEKKIKVFDGDNLCVFFSYFLWDLTKAMSKEIPFKMGVVLSEFNSKSSYDSLKENFDITFAEECFESLYKAAKKYEVAVVYEKSGKGTLYFSGSFMSKLDQGKKKIDGKIFSIVKTLGKIYSLGVPDGLVTMLVIKSILKSSEYFKIIKEDSTRELSVKITKEMVISNNKVIVEPRELQRKIEHESNHYKGRVLLKQMKEAEPKVKIYAETKTGKTADKLALKVAQIIYDGCAGKGFHPEISYI